jgi:DNA gyrase subunit A
MKDNMQQNLFNSRNDGKDISYLDEMKESFLDYAMSVITSRALPDVRDGLKPVQRRILYAMYKEGLLHNKSFSKCAGIVGEVLKKYHPHGDVAVYDTLVRLSQPWVLRCPLVEGQGNFGSIDGDSAAAYRYTEARLDKLSSYLMLDINKNTVDKLNNYNNTEKEPVVLPSVFPNLLINGTSGIAVGMATNIPSHNLEEVLDALTFMLSKKNIKDEEVMKFIKGPDFPTGAKIIDDGTMLETYKNGKGSIRLRAVLEIEKAKNKNKIVIKQIPYGVLKTRITSKIVDLIKTKKMEGITDVRDESNKEGIRIVLDLKKQAPVDFIIEKLYKHTPLDSNFAVNMVALVHGRPKQVSLLSVLKHFINHRKEVIRRRVVFDLNKAEEKKHILEGFVKVLLDKNRYLKQILPNSKDKANLKLTVEKEYKLTDVQSEALIVLPNYRFSGLEVDKILEDYKELEKEVKNLKSILENEAKVKNILKKEFLDLKKEFPSPRKTKIVKNFTDKNLKDLIPERDVVVALTNFGFVKRYNLDKENGERDSNIVFTGDDVVVRSEIADLSSQIFCFTSDARMYPVKVFDIPEMRRYGKGTSIEDFINLKENTSVLNILNEKYDGEILFITRKGYIKKVNLKEFQGIKKSGVSAFSLRKGDEIIGVEKVENENICFVEKGKSKLVDLKIKDIEYTKRSKAALKYLEEINNYSLECSDSLVFVSSSGEITSKNPNKKDVFICDKNSEIIAITNQDRSFKIDFSVDKINLNIKEKLLKLIKYKDIN